MAKQKKAARATSAAPVVEAAEVIEQDALVKTERDQQGREYVRVSIRLPRFASIELNRKAGAEAIKVDRARYSAARFAKFAAEYGEGRFLRDGAPTRKHDKDANGEVRERKLAGIELRESYEAHALKRYRVLCGEREYSGRSSMDPLARAFRDRAEEVCRKQLGLKAVPDSLKASAIDSVSDVRAALKALRVTDASIEKILEIARGDVERASLTDALKVDVSA